jgi:hypothetical protein
MSTHSLCLCLCLIAGIEAQIETRIVSQKVEVWVGIVDLAS